MGSAHDLPFIPGQTDNSVTAIADYVASVDSTLLETFRRNPLTPIEALLQGRANQLAESTKALWQLAGSFHQSDNHDLALVAIGGFGRGELHPHSDIDLLILYSEQPGPVDTLVIETFISNCWDAGLPVSHNVLTPDECVTQAREDVTFLTSLIQVRLLAGSHTMLEQLLERVKPEEIWSVPDYFNAKVKEQAHRHMRFDDTAGQLEPNIKQGPGGLRDLQTIAWVCLRRFGKTDMATLLGNGLLNEYEFSQLIESRDFMWRIRWANHMLAGRAEERLLFARQKQLAGLFGYEDDLQPTHAVEQFMQQYYRHNIRLQRYNERILQQFREELQGDEPAASPVQIINAHFQIRMDYLEVRQPELFKQDPAAILELFLVLQKKPDIKGVRATTIRLLRQAINQQVRLQPEFFARTETLRVFCQVLQQPHGVYTQLARMHRYGLLAHLLPGFAAVSGLMQFDLFHVYTVDQHTLFVVRNLRRMAYGKYADKFGHAIQLMQSIESPSILYLAALFHDIAKGRGGDHAELGAHDVKRFCRSADVPAHHIDLISWLVKAHLLMSHTAQRKDLSDPDVIQSFAIAVKTQRRLDHLYLLTVADIAATNPDLWNSWKDSLLWELYQKATDCFRRGLSNPISRAMSARSTRARVFSELLGRGYSESAITLSWQQFSESLFVRLEDDQLIWLSEVLLSERDTAGYEVLLRQLIDTDVTEIVVIGPSFDGFFATITTSLESMRCNIYNARIQSTVDPESGEITAVDLLQFTDGNDQPLQSRDCQRLQDEIRSRLEHKSPPKPMTSSVPARLREFACEIEISMTERKLLNAEGGAEQIYTELELRCIDRFGILSSIALLFLKHTIRLHDARIATFGERVEDTFLLTDYANKALTAAECEQLKIDLLATLSD